MVFCPRVKKTRFTPYNQGVKLLIIQVVKNSYLSNKECKDLVTFEVGMYYCGQKKWDIKFLSVLKNSM
jgi:hypothetical protein